MNISKNIVDTLKDNYMPYAMSVIVSRAIPQIDGFKPAHRKLLYTMHEMNLQRGGKTKSANVVGQTMKLNPHGDQAIYETMVRMTKNNESLLYPYVDSKGNFGKVYSRDMKFAAARYTEVKLMDICTEIFEDINKNTIDFVDNYDGTMKEPTLLPTKFPNILVNPNRGIAVGMASSIPSFNLQEINNYTIAYLADPSVKVEDFVFAPDFPTGGELLLDSEKMSEVLNTGRGSVSVRARYRVDKKLGIIEIFEIPYSTTVEAIIEKVIELMKLGKLKEVLDIRDETDLNGLKLTIDYRKSQDPHNLMLKLFRSTPLEDSFGCNFNILIDKRPRVMGIPDIIAHWIDFRRETLKRRVAFELGKNRARFNLLRGLQSILMDIDRVIQIIRSTEKDSEVVPTLCEAFTLNQEQAEYICEIKLRNLNKEYILKRLDEMKELEQAIRSGEALLGDPVLQNKEISRELQGITKKYGVSRKTQITPLDQVSYYDESEKVDDSQFHLFFTKDGYFKKITELSLKRSGEQKLKDSDQILNQFIAKSSDTIWIFTDKANLYQLKVSEVDETKASNLGLYLPNQLGMDPQEKIVSVINPSTPYKAILNVFSNGKIAKIDIEAYKTKGYRRKIQKAFNNNADIVAILPLEADCEMVITCDNRTYLRLDTSLLNMVSSRASQGVTVARLTKNARVSSVRFAFDPEQFAERTLKIPKTPKKLPEIVFSFDE